MVKKRYDWLNGAVLDEHSRRKLKILKEYFYKYLITRCQHPQQQRFRLSIVDGFSGGGRYKCGTAGSPILFMEGLQKAVTEININRSKQDLGAIEIECLLIFNDSDSDVIELLKSNCAPVALDCKQNTPNLHIELKFLNGLFERVYDEIKALLNQGSYRSAIFNLDQYGHTHVERSTLVDIMRLSISVEIFYTFAISSLITYLNKSQPYRLAAQLKCLQIGKDDMKKLEGGKTNDAWLGVAEQLVFENFRTCAPYVSPFSINNPQGWRYWLIHFASSYKARQVYNDTLHDNASTQAHFGRSGLNMLSYDPSQDGTEYLFDLSGRGKARDQLTSDIPRLISEWGDVLGVQDFYESIYNLTPAHKDDIHLAIAENSDLEVITTSGGKRRKPNTITVHDTIKLKKQRSFFPMFFQPEKKPEN